MNTSNFSRISHTMILAVAAGAAHAGVTPCFGPESRTDIGIGPVSSAFGDLDGDGDADMVVADRVSETVALRVNTGTTFTGTSTIPLDNAPERVVLADMNNDGNLDIVVAVRLTGALDRVLIFPGDGAGGFGPETSTPARDGISGLAVADLDADGDLDVVSTDAFNDEVVVNLGNGDGTLGPASSFATGGAPTVVAVGDVNGDGVPDAVTADRSDNTASVLLDNGDGTFAARTAHAVGSLPEWVAIGDTDGNGSADIVTSNAADGTVSILSGFGNGGFATSMSMYAGQAPSGLALDDMDNDGDTDIVVTNRAVDTASVLRNRGFGNNAFSSPERIGVGDNPRSVTLADTDGDGDLDLITTNRDSGDVSLILNSLGECIDAGLQFVGTFQGHDYYLTTEPVDLSALLTAAEGLADDRGLVYNQDVYAASINSADEEQFLIDSGAASWLIGFSDRVSEGTFVWENGDPIGYTNWCDGEPNNSFGEDAVELNRSGMGCWNDIRSFGSGGERFGLIELERDALCLAPEQRFAAGDAPQSVSLGDLDGDGDLDMATANFTSNDASVLLNNGDGTFAPEIRYATGEKPISVYLGDLDGDGDLDMATANSGSGENDVSVLLNNGDGSFVPQTRYSAGNAPVGVSLGDLNGNGTLDMVVANFFSDDASVLLNNGDGTFAAQTRYNTGDAPRSVSLGDLDGDGDPDMAVANGPSGDASVLLNNGDGTFDTQTRYDTGPSSESVSLGDLDGDGDLDMTVANANTFGEGNATSVLLNNGDGTFAAQTFYAAGNQPQSVSLGDLDGDGDLDMAVAYLGSFGEDNAASVLLNNGDGTFAAETFYDAGNNPVSVSLGDLDGDGDLDMAVANPGSDLSVLLNRSGECPADLDGNCLLDLADVNTFIDGFLNMNPIADLDNNNLFDLTDVQLFVASFVAGCP